MGGKRKGEKTTQQIWQGKMGDSEAAFTRAMFASEMRERMYYLSKWWTADFLWQTTPNKQIKPITTKPPKPKYTESSK